MLPHAPTIRRHTILDADRLTDMVNLHDEYDLADVTVERFAAPAGLGVKPASRAAAS